MKILILSNNGIGLYKFRKELVKELVKKNEVYISLPHGETVSNLKDLGCNFLEISMERRGTNPFLDLKLMHDYLRIIKKVKPNVVLTYTIKPNVYGGMACRIKGVPYIANITGLGTSIENRGILRTISLFLYKIGLKESKAVFFQNKANKNFFTENQIVNIEKTKEIPGSGVNLSHHYFEEYPEEDGTTRFLFIGRIMKAKGIDELFKAIEIIKQMYPNTEFHFVGSKEEDYDEKINELLKRKMIYYHNRQDNVHPFIKNSHAVINPSHHEGMSNVLLESASTGRPILASNIPGCKETFDEGISGLGFEAKNTNSLTETIAKFIELPYEEKKKMGLNGRKKVENEFDRNIVINEYLKAIGKF